MQLASRLDAARPRLPFERMWREMEAESQGSYDRLIATLTKGRVYL